MGLLDNALDEENSGYVTAWQYYYSKVNDPIAQRGYAVVGTQTDFADVAGNDCASYSGFAHFRTTPAASYTGEGSETRYHGEMTINVNFMQEQVDGSIKNIGARGFGDTSYIQIDDAQLDLDPAKINQYGEFAGTVSLNAVVRGLFNLDADDKEAYAGAFFGPNAD